jgi:hypothetical protein
VMSLDATPAWQVQRYRVTRAVVLGRKLSPHAARVIVYIGAQGCLSVIRFKDCVPLMDTPPKHLIHNRSINHCRVRNTGTEPPMLFIANLVSKVG